MTPAMLAAYLRYVEHCRREHWAVRPAASFRDLEELSLAAAGLRVKQAKHRPPPGRLSAGQRVKLRKLAAAGVVEHRRGDVWDYDEAKRVLSALGRWP